MRYLIVVAVIFMSCEGPQGIQGIEGVDGLDGEQGIQGIEGVDGLDGEQGIQGEQGISKIMFDHFVVIGDYYQSAQTGSWYAGIEHDSIRVSSMIDLYFKVSDDDMLWTPFLHLGEVTNGRIGLFDPNIEIYFGMSLRIIVIN